MSSKLYCGVGRPPKKSKVGTFQQCQKQQTDKELSKLNKALGRSMGKLSKAQEELKEYKRLDDDAPLSKKRYTKEINELNNIIPELKKEVKEARQKIKELKEFLNNKKCECK
jgi:predicted RNase H-like nuclease (RuvC/YqgF family)